MENHIQKSISEQNLTIILWFIVSDNFYQLRKSVKIVFFFEDFTLVLTIIKLNLSHQYSYVIRIYKLNRSSLKEPK